MQSSDTGDGYSVKSSRWSYTVPGPRRVLVEESPTFVRISHKKGIDIYSAPAALSSPLGHPAPPTHLHPCVATWGRPGQSDEEEKTTNKRTNEHIFSSPAQTVHSEASAASTVAAMFASQSRVL